MTKKIMVPATIAEAVETLDGIEALLTSRGWARAAIVAAFTTEGTPGPKSSSARKRADLSITDFAKLGISGLTKRDTVATYRSRWIEHGTNPDIGPGDEIVIPSTDWPPTRTGTDGHSSEKGAEKKVREIIADHPDVVAKAVGESDDVLAALAADDVGDVLTAARDVADDEPVTSKAIPAARKVAKAAATRRSGADEIKKAERQKAAAEAADPKQGSVLKSLGVDVALGDAEARLKDAREILRRHTFTPDDDPVAEWGAQMTRLRALVGDCSALIGATDLDAEAAALLGGGS